MKFCNDMFALTKVTHVVMDADAEFTYILTVCNLK